MKEFAFHPEKAAQALADTVRDFGYDGMIIDFDTCVLAEAMERPSRFRGTNRRASRRRRCKRFRRPFISKSPIRGGMGACLCGWKRRDC